MFCGYAYLAEKFDIRCLSLAERAEGAPAVNKLVRLPGQLLVPSRMVPDPEDVWGHLVFALKHEGVNLELLAQILPNIEIGVVQSAVDKTPGSAVLRKLAWLWEEFSHQLLKYDRPSGNYVDLCDVKEYFTGEKRQISRHPAKAP